MLLLESNRYANAQRHWRIFGTSLRKALNCLTLRICPEPNLPSPPVKWRLATAYFIYTGRSATAHRQDLASLRFLLCDRKMTSCAHKKTPPGSS
jgi:hypothetical protein